MLRLCWHDWSKWDSIKLQKIFDSDNPDGLPIEQYLVQQRICRKCGKVKMRRERV